MNKVEIKDVSDLDLVAGYFSNLRKSSTFRGFEFYRTEVCAFEFNGTTYYATATKLVELYGQYSECKKAFSEYLYDDSFELENFEIFKTKDEAFSAVPKHIYDYDQFLEVFNTYYDDK